MFIGSRATSAKLPSRVVAAIIIASCLCGLASTAASPEDIDTVSQLRTRFDFGQHQTNLFINRSVPLKAKECILTTPDFNTTYNIGGLKSDLGHIFHFGKNSSYRFNFCGTISTSCNGNKPVAACLIDNNTETILGYSGKGAVKNGIFSYSYVGDKCNADKPFTLTVVLQCDYYNEWDPYRLDTASLGQL